MPSEAEQPLSDGIHFPQSFPQRAFQHNQPILLIQNGALCKHIVSARVQFLQNQLRPNTIIRSSKPIRPFNSRAKGEPAFSIRNARLSTHTPSAAETPHPPVLLRSVPQKHRISTNRPAGYKPCPFANPQLHPAKIHQLQSRTNTVALRYAHRIRFPV